MIRTVVILGVFAGLVALLWVGLGRDPRHVPSPLVGRSLPSFSLPQVRDESRSLSPADLAGRVTLVNVWATWCVACRQEHPLLVEVERSGLVPIFGLNHKDDRGAAIDWLDRYGDPYVASGFDGDGAVGIDLGVYGLPETFVVGPDGTIAYKHIGPITPDAWQRRILPVIRRLSEVAG